MSCKHKSTEGESVQQRGSLVTARLLEEQGYPLCAQYFPGLTGLAYRLSFMYGQPHLIEDIKQLVISIAARLEPSFNTEFGTTFYTYVAPYASAEVLTTYGTAKKASPLYKEIEKFANTFLRETNRYPNILEIQKAINKPLWKIKSIFVYDMPREVPFDDAALLVPTAELENDIQDMLDNLPELQKRIVTYHVLDEKSLESFANTNNVPLKLVESQYAEAITTLRNLMS